MTAINVSKTNFEAEVSQSDKPVLVDFWSPTCGPCRMLAPVLDEIAAEHAGSYKIAKVNVAEDPELGAAFKVRAVPTLLFVKDGQARDQHVGAMSKSEILKRLAALA